MDQCPLQPDDGILSGGRLRGQFRLGRDEQVRKLIHVAPEQGHQFCVPGCQNHPGFQGLSNWLRRFASLLEGPQHVAANLQELAPLLGQFWLVPLFPGFGEWKQMDADTLLVKVLIRLIAGKRQDGGQQPQERVRQLVLRGLGGAAQGRFHARAVHAECSARPRKCC